VGRQDGEIQGIKHTLRTKAFGASSAAEAVAGSPWPGAVSPAALPDALTDGGHKPSKAKRHADRCRRVFCAVAAAGGIDADTSPEVITSTVAVFRDKQTGEDLLDDSRQLYHQSVRRFFKLMRAN